MTILLIVLLVVGIGVGIGLRKRGNAAGTAIVVACSAFGVLVAVGRLIADANAPARYETVQDGIQATQYIMAAELGRHLAEQAAGTQALCLLSPTEDNNQALEDGLVEGLGDGIPVVFASLDRADDPRQTMDTLELSSSMVRAILGRHPDADLLICMADLPMDSRGIATILKQNNVRLAAGNVLDLGALSSYASGGVFAGAAAYRDDAGAIDDMEKATPKEIFDSVYVLIPARQSQR